MGRFHQEIVQTTTTTVVLKNPKTRKQTLVDSSTFASGENGAPTIRESPILDIMEEFLSPVLQRKRDPKVLMIPRLMVPRLSRSRLRLHLLPKKLQRHEELEPEEG